MRLTHERPAGRAGVDTILHEHPRASSDIDEASVLSLCDQIHNLGLPPFPGMSEYPEMTIFNASKTLPKECFLDLVSFYGNTHGIEVSELVASRERAIDNLVLELHFPTPEETPSLL